MMSAYMNNTGHIWILLFITSLILTQQWGQWQTVLGTLRARWQPLSSSAHHRLSRGSVTTVLINHPRLRIDWPREAYFFLVLFVKPVCAIWFHWPFKKTTRFSASACLPNAPLPSRPTPPYPTSSLKWAWTLFLITFIWTLTERTKAGIPHLNLSACPPEPINKTKNSNTTPKNTLQDERSMSGSNFSQLFRAESANEKWSHPFLNLKDFPCFPRWVTFAKPYGWSMTGSSDTNVPVESQKRIQVQGLLIRSQLFMKKKFFLTFYLDKGPTILFYYPLVNETMLFQI